VTISAAQSTYPNINPTQSQVNSTPFVFSLASNFSCGADIQFQETVTDSAKTYHLNFLVNASVPGLRTDVLSNNVESGVAGWTTGGSPNTWAITTLQSHSPTHSWTDSPNGDYANNTNSSLNTPGFSLGGMRHTQVSFWTKYELEPGFDFVYLDYSTDGGATFSRDSQALATLNGISNGWEHFVLDTPNLDNQWNVVLRFRIVSDSGVTFDGVYLDDISVSYVPYSCAFGMQPRAYFPLLIR